MDVLDLLARLARRTIVRLDRSRLPRLDGALHLPCLHKPVEVVRDRWGVPHLYAQDSHDLFAAQGYVHAQDRLAQMELGRRFGHGRLSELLGPGGLPADRASRVLGFSRTALKDIAIAPPDILAVSQSYCDGVNAFLADPAFKAPVELFLARWRPTPWTPHDCMAWGRVMYWQLCRGWSNEVVRAMLVDAVGPQAAAELEIGPMPGEIPTLPDGIEVRGIDPAGMVPGSGPVAARGMGSNAWALSPQRTTTGGAILANDMHMPLMLPSFWYENHLVGGGFEVTGVSLPGIPLVLVGHNARISWGMTLAHTDAEDTFVERFDPANPHRYEVPAPSGTAPGAPVYADAEVIREEIRVRGRRKPHVEEVVITRHGPVVSGLFGAIDKRLALQSTALQPCVAARGWLLLNRAAGWDGFVEAMRCVETPPLNIVYADVDGNVGYWNSGTLPVRSSGLGDLPSPGWTGQGDWVGTIPFEQMPHALNPVRGYIVSCNQSIAGPDYPHFLGRTFISGSRALRVHQFIEERGRLGLQDCRSLQADVTSLPAREFVRRLEGLTSIDPDVRAALDLLRAWDGRLTEHSAAAAVYEAARHATMRRMLEPALGQDLTSRLLGLGFDPAVNLTNEFYGHDIQVLLRLLDTPDSWWVREAGGREALLVAGLKAAMVFLRDRLGTDPAQWHWGDLHGATFSHMLGDQPPLDRILNLGPVPVGGDSDTPNQTAMMPDRPYGTRAWAPTFRQIIDMADLSRSLVIHAPGQSGQFSSPHFDDLLDAWRRCEHHPMLWTRAQVDAEALHRLSLTPMPS
jgi:penicillin amidase